MKRGTRVHTKKKRRTPKHLHFHMIFVYSTMGIFVLTIALTVVQKTFEPFHFGNASSQYVLGESVSQEAVTESSTEKPFYIKIIDLILP